MNTFLLSLLLFISASQAMWKPHYHEGDESKASDARKKRSEFINLTYAIQLGDNKGVQSILEKKILSPTDLQKVDEFGNTPLTNAIRRNRIAIIDALLGYGALPRVVVTHNSVANSDEAVSNSLLFDHHHSQSGSMGQPINSRIFPRTVRKIIAAGACITDNRFFLHDIFSARCPGLLKDLQNAFIQKVYRDLPLIQAVFMESQPRFMETLSKFMSVEYLEQFQEAIMIAYGHEMFDRASVLYSAANALGMGKDERTSMLQKILKGAVISGKTKIVNSVLDLQDVHADSNHFCFLGELLELALLYDNLQVTEIILQTMPCLLSSCSMRESTLAQSNSAIIFFKNKKSFIQQLYALNKDRESYVGWLPRDVVTHYLVPFVVVGIHVSRP